MPLSRVLPFILVTALLVAATPASARDVTPDDFQARTYTGKSGAALPYRLFVPKNYDGKQKYPLVLFLHGAGERGTDNRAQVAQPDRQPFATEENQAKYPCFILAPQCPPEKRWVEVDWGSTSHTIPKEPSEPMSLLLELIPKLRKEFSIDSQRIYLTGLSMGGYGTWDLLARRPKLFAAAIPICGGADEATAPKIAHVPVWVFHGGADTVVPVVRSRNIVAALKKAGAEPKYTEYPGVGHNSWTAAYAEPELLPWLFSHRKP